MRKMMNKKGFSLVELMIVVVIMGILIAVAIPLYGAITKNANNKTCSTNAKNIRAACATYFSSYDQKAMDSTADLQNMMEDKKVPTCPLGGTYGIYVDKTTGAATVVCLNTKDGHSPDDVAREAPQDNNYNILQTAAAAT